MNGGADQEAHLEREASETSLSPLISVLSICYLKDKVDRQGDGGQVHEEATDDEFLIHIHAESAHYCAGEKEGINTSEVLLGLLRDIAHAEYCLQAGAKSLILWLISGLEVVHIIDKCSFLIL